MLKIGHRGASGYEPENTLASFKKAMRLKFDMVEFDVQMCKTGELVIIHDDKVNRTTNGKGLVREKTFKELRSLDAGKGQKIPTFKEVLNLVQGKCQANIELKTKGVAEAVAKELIKLFKAGVNPATWLVSSFHFKELVKFREYLLKTNPVLAGKIKIGILFMKVPKSYLKLCRQINAYSINPDLKKIKRKLINEAQQNGLKVFVFTVNTEKDIARMKEWGVDGIFSNFPDKI